MSIKRAQELKQLQSRKAKQQVLVNELDKEQREISRKYSEARNALNLICQQINELEQSKVTVSEHAIVRYLEKIYQLDLHDIENSILTPKVIEQIQMLGDGKYPIINELKVVVKNNTVVTVI